MARRRREIALLHAMGMTVREQLGAALLSGGLVGLVGATLGVALELGDGDAFEVVNRAKVAAHRVVELEHPGDQPRAHGE